MVERANVEVVNVEMAAAWDGPEGAHFAEHADRYEQVSRRHVERLLEAAELRPGDDVLDIGCGTGDAALDAAGAVAPGSVLGVDLSTAMLDVATRSADARGLTNVRFERTDAQVHPFEPAAFDVAMSSFGAMFFGDAVAAFRNIGAALRPGGRLALLAWQPLERNEWLTEIRAALAAGRTLPSPPAGAPGPFGLADPEQVERVLHDGGFTDVRLDPVNEPMYFGTDVDDAYGFISTFGITRGLTEHLDEPTRTQTFDELRRMIERHTSPEGVRLDSAAWLVTAHR